MVYCVKVIVTIGVIGFTATARSHHGYYEHNGYDYGPPSSGYWHHDAPARPRLDSPRHPYGFHGHHRHYGGWGNDWSYHYGPRGYFGLRSMSTTIPPTSAEKTDSPLTLILCMQSCPVTSQYNPVCGTNNMTYSNIGRLECANYCGVDVTLQRASPCFRPPSIGETGGIGTPTPTSDTSDQLNPSSDSSDQLNPSSDPSDQFNPTSDSSDQFNPTRDPGDQFNPSSDSNDQLDVLTTSEAPATTPNGLTDSILTEAPDDKDDGDVEVDIDVRFKEEIKPDPNIIVFPDD